MDGDKWSMCRILRDLGETSSLHGVPKLISARQMAMRLFYLVLIIGAVGLSFYHIMMLFGEYYSFPVKTTVSLNYGQLLFPSVTICHSTPFNINKLADDKEWVDLLLDYTNYNEVNIRTDSWTGREMVLAAVREKSTETRLSIGHQLDDIIYMLSFRGLKYTSLENISKVILSPFYGNCYVFTMNESSTRSGPEKGMRMILNVNLNQQRTEFLATGYGYRVSINQPGTFPLPQQDGLLVTPAHETNIGIKLVRVSRLGGDYGECSNGFEHKTVNGSAYSVPACHALCLRDHVRAVCGCILYYSPVDDDSEEEICGIDDSNKQRCVEFVEEDINVGSLKCDCPPKCFEDIYRMSITSRKWPNFDYLAILLRDVCGNSVQEPLFCKDYMSNIQNEDYLINREKVASNFLAVNIYFEDLNYEIVCEEPAYNTVRFLSDIGGAMELYIGASLLTYVEIIQLTFEVYLYFKEVYKSKRNKVEAFRAQEP